MTGPQYPVTNVVTGTNFARLSTSFLAIRRSHFRRRLNDLLIAKTTMMRSLLLIALSVPFVKAQQVGPQPCRADPSVVGYSSIAQLNRDMLVEQQRIADGGTPQDSYLFTLCPFTDFDVTSGPLLPLLDNSMFLCGASGDVGDECTLTGGTAQVRIQDSTVPGFPLATVSFTGLTFSGFTTNAAGTGASIQAVASTTTTATFTDVRWQVRRRRTRRYSPRSHTHPLTVHRTSRVIL